MLQTRNNRAGQLTGRLMWIRRRRNVQGVIDLIGDNNDNYKQPPKKKKATTTNDDDDQGVVIEASRNNTPLGRSNLSHSPTCDQRSVADTMIGL
jgi:hypothetical protein